MEVVLMVAVPVGGGGAGGGGGARLAHKPRAHIYKRPNLQTLSLLSPATSSLHPSVSSLSVLLDLIFSLSLSPPHLLLHFPSLFRSVRPRQVPPTVVSLL